MHEKADTTIESAVAITSGICEVCLDRTQHTTHGPTHSAFHTDSHPHHARLPESCMLCENKGDLGIVCDDGLGVPLCARCAFDFNRDKSAVVLRLTLRCMQLRAAYLDTGLAGGSETRAQFHLLETRANDLIDHLYGHLHHGFWIGPDKLWHRSGIIQKRMNQHLQWLDRNLGAIRDQWGDSDDVHCPPHIDETRITTGHRVIDLARAHTRAARLFWINAAMSREVADAAAQLPSLDFTDDMACAAAGGERVGLATFDEPISLDFTIGVLVALQWALVPGGVWITPMTHAWCHRTSDTPPESLYPISPGYFLPYAGADINSGNDYESHQISSVLVAFWRMATQPISQSTQTVAPAVTTKKRRRRIITTPEATVTVMELRKPENPDSGDTTDTDTAGRKWTLTKRIEVSGHWRNQRTGKGRSEVTPTWVRWHERGPEDAPKSYTQKIRAMRR